MRKFLHDKNSKILIITLVILTVMSVFSHNGSNIFSGAVNTVTKGLSTLTAGAASSDKSKEELEKENEQLKKENAELREQLVDYLDAKEENAKLWKYYELKKENPSYDILPAGVLRRDANDDFYSFTLDKGSTDNVEKNDPVITENGLIGWVSDVELTTCRVRTILSPDTKASAIDKKTSDNGIISGNAEYCDDNLTCLTKIAENNKIKVGDIVVTSGTGGVYPKNLIIGKVKELKFNSYDTTRYAVVEPYEDIRTVTLPQLLPTLTARARLKNDESFKNFFSIFRLFPAVNNSICFSGFGFHNSRNFRWQTAYVDFTCTLHCFF